MTFLRQLLGNIFRATFFALEVFLFLYSICMTSFVTVLLNGVLLDLVDVCYKLRCMPTVVTRLVKAEHGEAKHSPFITRAV